MAKPVGLSMSIRVGHFGPNPALKPDLQGNAYLIRVLGGSGPGRVRVSGSGPQVYILYIDILIKLPISPPI